jgi:hypothetical protein
VLGFRDLSPRPSKDGSDCLLAMECLEECTEVPAVRREWSGVLPIARLEYVPLLRLSLKKEQCMCQKRTTTEDGTLATREDDLPIILQTRATLLASLITILDEREM